MRSCAVSGDVDLAIEVLGSGGVIVDWGTRQHVGCNNLIGIVVDRKCFDDDVVLLRILMKVLLVIGRQGQDKFLIG